MPTKVVRLAHLCVHLRTMDAPSWNYSVRYVDPLRTENTHLASGQTIVTDAPTDNHGLGQTFSPTDLLSTSLAACVMTIMGIHVQGKDYRIESIDANVQKTMASSPRRLDAIEVVFEVRVSGSCSDQDLAVLERVARACPVAKSLHPDVAQNLAFQFYRV